jgi:hypothetical protein
MFGGTLTLKKEAALPCEIWVSVKVRNLGDIPEECNVFSINTQIVVNREISCFFSYALYRICISGIRYFL